MPRGIYDRSKAKPRGYPRGTPTAQLARPEPAVAKVEPAPPPPPEPEEPVAEHEPEDVKVAGPAEVPLSLPEGLTVIDLFRPQNRVQQIAQLISELTETDLADIDAEILKHERQLVGLDAVRQMFRRPAPPPPAVVDLREGPAPKKAPVRKKQALPPPPPPAQEPEEEDWQPPAAEEPAHPLGEDDDHSPLPPAADPPLDEGEGEDEGVVALEPGAEPPPQAAEGVEAKLLWLRKRVVRYIAKMGRAVRSGEIIRGVPLGPRWINRVLDHAWFSQSSQGVHITPQARQAVLDE